MIEYVGLYVFSRVLEYRIAFAPLKYQLLITLDLFIFSDEMLQLQLF